MRYIFFVLLLCVMSTAFTQPKYTVSNAHSHNDYEQKIAFWTAYNEGFGSIEADIFLDNDSLYIAHTTEELKARRTLRQYYVEPLASMVKKNMGYVYSDSRKHLQLLIDLKTDSIKTLNALINLLKQYPALINTSSVQFVIQETDRIKPYLLLIHHSSGLMVSCTKIIQKKH